MVLLQFYHGLWKDYHVEEEMDGTKKAFQEVCMRLLEWIGAKYLTK